MTPGHTSGNVRGVKCKRETERKEMNTWTKLTEENPVSEVRRGYANSGFEFRFVRCLDVVALRDYVKANTRCPHQAWFDDPAEVIDIDSLRIPPAFSVVSCDSVLDGVFKESVGNTLVTCHMIVVAEPEDRGDREARHWYHEIGHVAAKAAVFFPDVFMTGLDHEMVAADVPEYNFGREEFPGFCTEYLTQVANALMRGDPEPVSSGFNQLFPWLKEVR